MNRQIISNALLVLPDRTVEGSLVIEDGLIAEIAPGKYVPGGIDLGGQFLIPGVIDIHTDYLEKEINPRPSAAFPLAMAFHTMDVRAVTCGLTTVLGAARISSSTFLIDSEGRRLTGWRGDGLGLRKAYRDLRRTALARHLIHVRWNPNFEPVEDILAELLTLESIGNIVYNDSAPGQRQFRLEDQIRKYASHRNVSIAEATAHFEERIEAAAKINNRPAVESRVGRKDSSREP